MWCVRMLSNSIFLRYDELIVQSGKKAGAKTIDEVTDERRTPMTFDAELHSLHAAVR